MSDERQAKTRAEKAAEDVGPRFKDHVFTVHRPATKPGEPSIFAASRPGTSMYGFVVTITTNGHIVVAGDIGCVVYRPHAPALTWLRNLREGSPGMIDYACQKIVASSGGQRPREFDAGELARALREIDARIAEMAKDGEVKAAARLGKAGEKAIELIARADRDEEKVYAWCDAMAAAGEDEPDDITGWTYEALQASHALVFVARAIDAAEDAAKVKPATAEAST